jgi:hypothetical protein
MTEDARLKDFAVCRAALDKLGVEYNTAYEYRGTGEERRRHEIPFFENISLPFTPDTWMSLVRNDGDHYIGGCCGSSSAMQDQVCEWFRMAHSWVRIGDLGELALAMNEHDGAESSFGQAPETLFDCIEEQTVRWGDLPPGKMLADPWGAMAVIWHLTKNHYIQQEPAAHADHVSPLEKSLSMVERVCRAISWQRLFRDQDGKHVGPTSQEKVERALALARFLPALKSLYEHAEELYYGPVTGVALIEREKGPMAIAQNGRGYCIFETEAEAHALLDIWDGHDAEHESRRNRPPARERFALRPVRVDLHDGLVFTDTGERYTGKNEQEPVI